MQARRDYDASFALFGQILTGPTRTMRRTMETNETRQPHAQNDQNKRNSKRGPAIWTDETAAPEGRPAPSESRRQSKAIPPRTRACQRRRERHNQPQSLGPRRKHSIVYTGGPTRARVQVMNISKIDWPRTLVRGREAETLRKNASRGSPNLLSPARWVMK